MNKLGIGEHGEPRSWRLRDGVRMDASDRRRPDAWRSRVYYRALDGSLKQAQAQARNRHLAEAAALRKVRAKTSRTSSHWTPDTLLTEACDDYLARKAADPSTAASTITAYRGAVARNIAAGGSSVCSLTLRQAADVQTMRDFLQEVADSRSLASVRHVRAVLAGVFSEAESYRVIDADPMPLVKSPRRGRQVPRKGVHDSKRALSKRERDHVLQVADRLAADARARVPESSRRTNRAGNLLGSKAGAMASAQLAESTATLIYLLAGTGVRINEALGVRWDDVDLESGIVHVRGTKTASSDRHLNLPPWLIERLGALPHRDGYVVHSPRRVDVNARWDVVNAGKRVSKVLEEAGFPETSSHVFRKSVASILDDAGVPTRRIADQLGHTDVRTVQDHYLGRDPHGSKDDIAAHL